ncbi:hypothetical protein TWF751_002951 [Orbilia oligospora]|nr:hypothetical protein TWF751_002951 [Orbilia oligospora]
MSLFVTSCSILLRYTSFSPYITSLSQLSQSSKDCRELHWRSVNMAPAPTVEPGAIKTLPASLAATAMSDPSDPPSTDGRLRFDASTIAAVALGVALFFTIVGVIGYCFWVQRQKRNRYRYQVDGLRGHWARIEQPPVPVQTEKTNFPPAYAKRISFSARPSFSKPSAGIDITQIGHPKLIQSSQDIDPVFAEPKAAYIRAHKGPIAAVTEPQIGNVDFILEKMAPHTATAIPPVPPTVEIAKPPAVLTMDPKKRQNAPKLSLQTSTKPRDSINNNITSTIVAGLPTNIYVPPTPSRTGFGDVPFTPRTPRRMDFGPEPQAFKSDNQKSQLECFSPNNTRAYRNPTPKERYRFSDPTTPTPASVRSVRSLSWNGRANDHTVGFQTIIVQTPISPQQLRSPTICFPRHQNLIPGDHSDLDRESMQTHPHSRIVSSLSTQHHKSTSPPEEPHRKIRKPKLKIIPAKDDDEILTDDDASIIESECDSSDESSETTAKMFTHNNRSSVRTGRTGSTRFSQDSIPNPPLTPFYGEVKDNNPYINQMEAKRKANGLTLSTMDTPTRTLSSPGIEIVTRPGDESPPLSPVTFRIDTNPGSMTPKLPYKSEPYDRIEADRINDGSYPPEWKVQMERQATEEGLARRERDPRPKSIGNNLAPPPKSSKTKGVSFRLGGHHRDASDEKPILPKIDVSLAETMKQMRPNFYKIGTNDSDVSMI